MSGSKSLQSPYHGFSNRSRSICTGSIHRGSSIFALLAQDEEQDKRESQYCAYQNDGGVPRPLIDCKLQISAGRRHLEHGNDLIEHQSPAEARQADRKAIMDAEDKEGHRYKGQKESPMAVMDSQAALFAERCLVE